MGRFPPLAFRDLTLTFDRVYLVGVVNVTPDSFSDGGRLGDVESAVRFALQLEADGADVLDVGGESTRPGAVPVDARDEISRVVPVIRALRERARHPIAVDTTKAEVAAAALEAGAELVNDISGGAFDPDVGRVCARTGAVYVCGHLRGSSLGEAHQATAPTVEEVIEELWARLTALPGDLRPRTIVDPGLGFGKAGPEANLPLLARLGELAASLARPVLVGPSRKRFLGALTGRDVDDRDDATIGACLAAARHGADLLRVHAVRRVRDALTVYEAVER